MYELTYIDSCSLSHTIVLESKDSLIEFISDYVDFHVISDFKIFKV